MNEKGIHFYGTYFDKDRVIKTANLAGIFAWVGLGIYVFTSFLSFTQFMFQFSTGLFFQKGQSIIDLLTFFTPYLLQPLPGAAFFFGLKLVQNALLILLDMEESLRRASRKK